MAIQESMQLATEADKLMRVLATEAIKSMQALALQIKPAVQQERMQATLASGTEILLDRDIQIALCYCAVKIPLLVDIGATAFWEGDISSATVSWATILSREQHEERRT